MDILKKWFLHVAASTTAFAPPLECRSHTKVKNEKILIAQRIAIGIKGKINSRRANGQQILKTEADTGTESLEKVIESI